MCILCVCVCVFPLDDLHLIAGELQDQHTSLDKPGLDSINETGVKL